LPKTTDETLRPTGPLNTLFAASSILMLLVLGWMTWDDYHRGWKSYQARFFRLDAEKTRADIEKAQQAIDQQALADQKAALEAARAEAAQHKDAQSKAEQELRDVERDIYRDDLSFRKYKSTFDAYKFDYEEAAHAGSPKAAGIQREMDELQKNM
jgi:multidrug efflux pump subunit AcrA (membrane-fusion protein)